MTKQLSALGMTFEFDDATIEGGMQLIDTQKRKGASVVVCLMSLSQQLKLTRAGAVAIYAEHKKRQQPNK